MTKAWIQFAGLIALSLLAGGLLGLICFALYLMGNNISADGKVPVLDAGLFTASLLAFQQVIGAIRSVWESQERAAMAENLQNSTPTQGPAAGTTTTTTTVEPDPPTEPTEVIVVNPPEAPAQVELPEGEGRN